MGLLDIDNHQNYDPRAIKHNSQAKKRLICKRTHGQKGLEQKKRMAYK